MNAITLNPSDYITVSDKSIRTTSLKVAEAFNKRHSHVTDKVAALDCSEAGG